MSCLNPDIRRSMQLQGMTLFLVIGVLTAPALAIKIDRRLSPNIDELPLMNSSMKVEPVLASGGGGAAAADHPRPGPLGALQSASRSRSWYSYSEKTRGIWSEVFASDGKPGGCGCEKDKTYNHIFMLTPMSLIAAKAECEKVQACTGIVWAPKAPWDMTVNSKVPGMVEEKCGFVNASQVKAWRVDVYPNLYRCFMKEKAQKKKKDPNKLLFVKLANGLQTWKVRVSPGRCTNSEVKAACASKGLRPLCSHDSYAGSNCDRIGISGHMEYGPSYKQFGLKDKYQTAGICLATNNGNRVLYGTGNSHCWGYSNCWIHFADGKRIKAWDQDAKGWWTLCRKTR